MGSPGHTNTLMSQIPCHHPSVVYLFNHTHILSPSLISSAQPSNHTPSHHTPFTPHPFTPHPFTPLHTTPSHHTPSHHTLHTTPLHTQALANVVYEHLQAGKPHSVQLTLRCPLCTNPVCGKMREFFCGHTPKK